MFIPECMRVVTYLIACQRCFGNLGADELISTVSPVVRHLLPFSVVYAVHVVRSLFAHACCSL